MDPDRVTLMVSEAQIKAALTTHGGILNKSAAKLKITRQSLWERVQRSV